MTTTTSHVEADARYAPLRARIEEEIEYLQYVNETEEDRVTVLEAQGKLMAYQYAKVLFGDLGGDDPIQIFRSMIEVSASFMRTGDRRMRLRHECAQRVYRQLARECVQIEGGF